MTATVRASSALVDERLTGPVELTIDEATGVVTSIDPATGPVPDRTLTPGFVDLQVNGIDDVDCAHADGTDWDRLDELLLDQGTTSWCPTLISSPLDSYAAPLGRIAAAMARPTAGRPHLLGVHLEGPFLGTAPGAHRPGDIVAIDLDWIDALPDHVRLMTLGAEQPGAPEAIRRLRARGVAVSIGHSRPSEAEFEDAVAAGAAMVTHLFNGMSGIHHREPGLAAFALTEPGVSLGLIADRIHVHPRVIRLAFATAAERIVLVTDSTAWRAGTAGAVRLALVDGAPRLPDGTLAGSCVTMNQAIGRAIAAGGPYAAALAAATINPARVAGALDRGAIAVGRPADLVALGPSFTVEAVWVGGRQVR